MLERIGRSPWIPAVIGLFGLTPLLNAFMEAVANGWRGSFAGALLRETVLGTVLVMLSVSLFGLVLGMYHRKKKSHPVAPVVGIILGVWNVLFYVACVVGLALPGLVAGGKDAVLTDTRRATNGRG